MINYLHSQITDPKIRAFFYSYNKLGYGFLKKVYKSAIMKELKRFVLDCERQKLLNVIYEDLIIGEYFADI